MTRVQEYDPTVTNWPEATREAALERLRNGETIAQVERALDGPTRPTLSRWATRAGIDVVQLNAEKTQRARESAALNREQGRWSERRAQVADDAGNAAELALTVAVQALEDGKPRTAKDAATTFAILVDKAQLLTGAATDRTDHTGLQDRVLDQAMATAPNLRAVS